MLKIMIVEDSPTQAQRLAIILEHAGYKVDVKADASMALEALEALDKNTVDIILSDIVMPGMSGYEFCKTIKNTDRTKDIPVVLISGLTDPMEIVHAIECGAENFISKPYQEDVLLKRIKDVLTRVELRKQNKEKNNEIYFMGTTFNLTSNPRRALELLVSSFEDTVRTNNALRENRVTLQKAHTLLTREQERSEALLLNVLPKEIATRLKNDDGVIADKFSDLSILFADICGFTEMATHYTAQELVSLLNGIFSKFDKLCEKYKLEKIKTIGDAYMVASGLPNPRPDHAKAIGELALEMQEQLAQFNEESHKAFQMRIGINSGPAVAGVIGRKKFLYDLWGDTVNTASRMESYALPGSIQVTEKTYQIIKNDFKFEEREPIQVKGKGMMKTYFLKGKRD